MDCLTHCGAAGSHSIPPAPESCAGTALKEWQGVMVLSIMEWDKIKAKANWDFPVVNQEPELSKQAGLEYCMKT